MPRKATIFSYCQPQYSLLMYMLKSQYSHSSADVYAKNIDANTSKKLYELYRCDDPYEFCIKARLMNLDFGIAEFMAICKIYCYHYAFWPHTRSRFKAFKQILRWKKPNPFSKIKIMKELKDVIDKQINHMSFAIKYDSLLNIPGHHDEVKAWKMIKNIIEKI